MRTSLRLLVALGLVWPVHLSAQSAVGGAGPWLSTWLGGGLARVHCAQCLMAGNDGGLTAGLGGGFGVGSRVHLAVTLDGWVRPPTGSRTHHAFASIMTSYTPIAGRGLFVAAGGGVSRYVRRTTRDQTTLTATALSPSFKVQIGYEVRLGNEFLLVPAIAHLHSLAADEKVSGTRTGFRLRREVWQLALGIRWLAGKR